MRRYTIFRANQDYPSASVFGFNQVKCRIFQVKLFTTSLYQPLSRDSEDKENFAMLDELTIANKENLM